MALYGCMYYGMLRPSEAASLLLDECTLPDTGWGLLEFSEISSAAGRDWTDDGEVHEAASPRAAPVTRSGACPSLLCWSPCSASTSRAYGTAPDGRLFQTYRGGIYLPSTLWHVLQKARARAFTQAAARVPADPQALRLPARGCLLAAQRRYPGAPWSPSGPGTRSRCCYRIYAHCIDGDDDRWFGRMEDAL